MNNHKIKVEVTVDGSDTTPKTATPKVGTADFSSPPSCSKGYAVYQYENNKLYRVGSGYCTGAVGGSSDNWPTAWASIAIGSALNYQLLSIEAGHPDFKDLRFVMCCGTTLASEIPGHEIV